MQAPPSPTGFEIPFRQDPRARARPRRSLRAFRLAGIEVEVHWTWFAFAAALLAIRPSPYSAQFWNAAELLAGFGLVLAHELAHVFVGRWCGGYAARIRIGPLGGLAYVALPLDPRATLATVAAGPLVHVLVLPLPWALAELLEVDARSDFGTLLGAVACFNALMLVVNLLPLYPLDGGRLVQAVLWSRLGRTRSLAWVSGLGMAGGVTLLGFSLAAGDYGLAVAFAFVTGGAGLGTLRALVSHRLASVARRPQFRCPTCRQPPPVGPFWLCERCGGSCDAFEPGRDCPAGGAHVVAADCPECGRELRGEEWWPSEWKEVGAANSSGF